MSKHNRTLLSEDFYLEEDVVRLARRLLGKVLVTRFGGKTTSGYITETEAYNGISDKASHAYGGRRTKRTEIMYRAGGAAYVYLCYGIHSLFNVVGNHEGIPHAVLIRAIQPLEGIRIMEHRRNKPSTMKGFSNGPGSVSQALGIHFSHSGLSLLTGHKVYIEDHGIIIPGRHINVSRRIGVDYAEEDALLPYRFYIDKISG